MFHSNQPYGESDTQEGFQQLRTGTCTKHTTMDSRAYGTRASSSVRDAPGTAITMVIYENLHALLAAGQ